MSVTPGSDGEENEIKEIVQRIRDKWGSWLFEGWVTHLHPVIGQDAKFHMGETLTRLEDEPLEKLKLAMTNGLSIFEWIGFQDVVESRCYAIAWKALEDASKRNYRACYFRFRVEGDDGETMSYKDIAKKLNEKEGLKTLDDGVIGSRIGEGRQVLNRTYREAMKERNFNIEKDLYPGRRKSQ